MAADAVQQARNYAEMLDLKYAYATNGADIIEIDYFAGTEKRVHEFASGECRQYKPGCDPFSIGRWFRCLHSRSTQVNDWRTLDLVPDGLGSMRALVYAFLVFTGQVALASDRENCERLDMSEFISPDAHWIARVYGKVCDLGITSSAAVLVDLVRSGSSDAGTTVLSIDMPSNSSDWPRPKWESSKALAVQLSDSSNIALQMASFQSIEIHVRFCPSDPEERAHWAAYRAAYHKWVQEMSAWSTARKRDPGGAGPEPHKPTPPGRSAPDLTCQR